MSIKVERLVNLTIALLESRKPMSFAEIRSRTGYYDQGEPESARRMFERDKDELRSLGVPVQLVDDPLSGEVSYVVDRRAYEMPDVDLDRDEVAALAMALRLAGRPDDRLALSKLAARSPDPLVSMSGPQTRMWLETDQLDELAEALSAGRVVEFQYRTAQGSSAQRTVDPYTVVLRSGAWYLVGRDHDRDAIRAFRLDRIDGAMVVTDRRAASEAPADLDVTAHVSGPRTEGVDIDLHVTEAARWAVEARGGVFVADDDDGLRYRIASADAGRIVPWLLNLATDVTVIAPAAVRDEVLRRLRDQVAVL